MPTIVNVEENVLVVDPTPHDDTSKRNIGESRAAPIIHINETPILDLQSYAAYDFPSDLEPTPTLANRQFDPRHLQSFPSSPSTHFTLHSDLSNTKSTRSAPVGRPPNKPAYAERLCPPTSTVQNHKRPRPADRLPYRAISPLSYPHPNSATRVNSSTNAAHTSSTGDGLPRCQNVHLQQAIVEHGFCDIDQLPKLVVRQTKTYAKRSIDSMGQLFPTWFQKPDYRCIHCFTCDQVFTPQRFMIHLDDDGMRSEPLLDMSPIELLSSEQMSESKVRL